MTGGAPAMFAVLKHYVFLICRRRSTVVSALILLGMVVYLYMISKPPRKKVDLYIVEEHHEVVRYWYHESVLHSFNATGNTLIHIDAHADLAAPMYRPGFPFFWWPRDESQIFNMQQRNDMFIQAAASTGMINHVIWIYPSWDDTHDSPYQAYELGLGYIKNLRNGTHKFCECQTPLDKTGAKVMEKVDCVHLDMSNHQLIDVSLKPPDCHVMKTVLVEQVEEDTAKEIAEKDSWMRPLNSVLLDIDEDYFGCESGYDGLHQAQVEWSTVDKINDKLTNFICPLATYQEELADKLIKDVISELIKLCKLLQADDTCTKDLGELRHTLDVLVEKAFEEEHTMFCSDTATEALFVMGDLLGILYRLPLEGLQAILGVGVCLNTSPATLGFSEGLAELRVCHGVNTPNESVVMFYSPEVPEVYRRMNDLHDILSFIQKLKPKVVTLCRSVRDGYTPRGIANIVEDGLLEFFRVSNEESEEFEYKFIFDDNLLGGVKGWEGRYLFDKYR